jgi:hypothetical protein
MFVATILTGRDPISTPAPRSRVSLALSEGRLSNPCAIAVWSQERCPRVLSLFPPDSPRIVIDHSTGWRYQVRSNLGRAALMTVYMMSVSPIKSDLCGARRQDWFAEIRGH